jgi:hypothetical protein
MGHGGSTVGSSHGDLRRGIGAVAFHAGRLSLILILATARGARRLGTAGRRPVLALAAAAGAGLLIAADLTTLRGVRVFGSDVTRVSGGAHHGYAVLAIGVAALPIAWVAAVARRRLAMGALVLAGIAAAAAAAVADLPSLGSASPADQFYARTTAWTGSAVYLELVGAALLVASGVGLLALKPASRAGSAVLLAPAAE